MSWFHEVRVGTVNFIKTKRSIISQIEWLIGRRSQLSLENKLLIYKISETPSGCTELNSVWRIELWGCSKPSNTKILHCFQSKTLRIITKATWHVSNAMLHKDLQVPYISEVLTASTNKTRDSSTEHSNNVISQLHQVELLDWRLKICWPDDLTK